MKRINNGQVRQYVQDRKEFKNHTGSLYGYVVLSMYRQITHRYVVCSYGGHHPLFIYEWVPDSPADGVWYENVDGVSKTTSRHRTQAHPHTACTPMTTEQMRLIADVGLMGMMRATAKY